MTDTPEVIFLQPDCCVDWANEGRQWCEHDVWGDDCDNHEPATKYVRVDAIPATLQAENARLRRLLVLWRSMVNEGGVPRYTITPGAALNTVVTDTDRTLAALKVTPHE